MNKKTLLLLVVVFLLSTVLYAADLGKGAASITLYGGNLGKVEFPHHTHQDAFGDCNICHALFPKSSGAVQDFISRQKLKKKQVMNNCKKCHRKLVKAGETAGPTKCKECHSK